MELVTENSIEEVVFGRSILFSFCPDEIDVQNVRQITVYEEQSRNAKKKKKLTLQTGEY